MGALTLTPVSRGVMGNLRWVTVNVGFSTSYATGGDTGMTAAALGMDSVELVQFDQPAGFTVNYNYSNGQVLARRTAIHNHTLHFNQADVVDGATTTVNVGTNLMGANTGVDIVVAGVADATGAGGIIQAAQAALAEPAATTNLSATVVSAGVTNAVRAMVFGR